MHKARPSQLTSLKNSRYFTYHVYIQLSLVIISGIKATRNYHKKGDHMSLPYSW